MLISTQQGAGFLISALLITISPGPDNLMVLATGIARGRKLGMLFGLGCALGCLSHTLLAALGISAIIAASPWAFTALKIIGGGYLVFLGWLALRSNGIATNALSSKKGSNDLSGWHLFLKGLFANAINPKVGLFFLSFLPQFVNAQQGDIASQTAQLGLIFTAQAIVIFSVLGFFSGALGGFLQRYPAAGKWLDRLAGCVFIALGLRLMIQ